MWVVYFICLTSTTLNTVGTYNTYSEAWFARYDNQLELLNDFQEQCKAPFTWIEEGKEQEY